MSAVYTSSIFVLCLALIVRNEPTGLGSMHQFRNIEYTNVMPDRPNGYSLDNNDAQEALRQFKADIFRALAHSTRIHIIECLRDGEMTVGGLLERIPVEPANVSQHLALLRSKRLVRNRKEGNLVYYSLRDPLLIEVLDAMKKYFLAHLEESLALIREMEQQA